MKKHIRKWFSLILALIMALSCAAASAGTVYTRLTVDSEAAQNILPTFGVPADQLASVQPFLSLLNALGVKVITLEDGLQIDLGLNGKDVLSLGYKADDQGIGLVSTLFPNYSITASQEALSNLLQGFMANMPAMGAAGAAGGTGAMDMTAMIEPFMKYFTKISESFTTAAVPGEPVPGEYEFEGIKFDTMVPVTINIPAIAETIQATADEMLADEAILSAIQGFSQGAPVDVDQIKEGIQEFITHFPDEVTAEHYGNSNADGSPAFYQTGKASYKDKEEPSYLYDILFREDGSMKMGFQAPEMQMVIAVESSTAGFKADFTMGEMYYGISASTVAEGEDSTVSVDIFMMDPSRPLLNVTVLSAAAAERTLPVETEGKTVVTLEELMSGEGDAASGLVTDIMTNGLSALMPAITEAVPDLAPLLGMLMMGGASTVTKQAEDVPAETPAEEAPAKVSDEEVPAETKDEEAPADITGDWAADYLGILMYFYFNEDGTYLALPADDTVSGSNLAGTWTFDGETLSLYGEEGESGDALLFTFDGETLNGTVAGMDVVLYRPIEAEEDDDAEDGLTEAEVTEADPKEAEGEVGDVEPVAADTGDTKQSDAGIVPAEEIEPELRNAAADPSLTEERLALFGKAMEGLVGVDYVPIAYLGTEAVGDAVHVFLCQGTVVVPDATPEWKLVHIYVDPDGNITIDSIDDLIW